MSTKDKDEMNKDEMMGCLVGFCCFIGLVVGVTAGVKGIVHPFVAVLLIPVAALLYALIGRFMSEQFCLFADWAFGGGGSSFSELGVGVALAWPLTPILAIPLLVYGCVRRMF